MELDQIKQICKTHECEFCPLAYEDGFCMLEEYVYDWDTKEIKRRLEDYGKEKSTDSGREI